MKKLLVLLALCMVLSIVMVACEEPVTPPAETTQGTTTDAPTTDAPTTEEPTTEETTTEPGTTEEPGTTTPPETSTEETTTPPPPPADPVKVGMSFDQLYTGNGPATAGEENFFTPGQSGGWDGKAVIEDYNVQYVTVWGWVAFFAETPGTFGYQIGDADPVFSADFYVEPEQPVIDAALAGGGKSAARMHISIPVEYVSGEEITVKALAQDAAGTIETLVEFKLTKPVNPNAPVAFVAGASMYPDITGGSGFNKDNFVVAADGSYLTIDTIGQGDPYYTIKGLTGVATHVAIKYRTESTYTGAEMFVGSGAGRSGNGDNVKFKLTCDGNWQLAVVDVSGLAAVTDNVINYVSWDPFDNVADATMDVAYVALFTSAEAAYAYDAQFADIYRNVPVHDDLPVTLGTRDGDTPFSPATDKKIGQKLPLGETILKQITIKALACYSDGNTNTWSFKIWQWAGDYESTVAGTPLYAITGENHGDCQDFVANIPAKLLISGDVYYEAEYLTGSGGFTGWTAKDIYEGVETYSGGAKRDGGYAAEVVVGVPYVQPENGDAEHPLTVGQTLAATSGLEDGQATDVLYYTTGVVTEIGEGGSYYKNVYFTDGENTMLIYTLNPMEGMGELMVGDTITVCGYVKNYKGTIEFASKKMEDESQVYVYIIAHEAAPAEKVVIDPRTLEEGAITGHLTTVQDNSQPIIAACGLETGVMLHQGSIYLGEYNLMDYSKVVIYFATDWGEGTQAGLAAAQEQGFGKLGISAADCNGMFNPTDDKVFLGTPYTPSGMWAITAHEIPLGIEYSGSVYVSADFLEGQFIVIDRIEFYY